MRLLHRKIDFENDVEYVLERHCRNSYECDSPWARKKSYEEYKKECYDLKDQRKEFIKALAESTEDERAIAEIIETHIGEKVAFLWCTFNTSEEGDFSMAYLQEIYVEEGFRQQGIAAYLVRYAEDKAKANGAKVLRSGTGVENFKSKSLHEKLGFQQYRYEFEKLLTESE